MREVYGMSPSREGLGYHLLGYGRSCFVGVISKGQAVNIGACFAVLEKL
jgi:hypothetical protein